MIADKLIKRFCQHTWVTIVIVVAINSMSIIPSRAQSETSHPTMPQTTLSDSIPLAIRHATITISAGGRMYYEEVGEGEPLIFLHGHSLDHRMWADQVELLKDSFHIINPDLRGYGQSSDPNEGYQFTHMDDIITLMDSLHIEKAHVVGLSMGAYVAGDMVALCPDRLLSCVMVSGETCQFESPRTPRSAKEKAAKRKNIAAVKADVTAYKQMRINDLLDDCYEGNREKVRPVLEEEVMDWGAWQALHVTGRVYYGLDAWSELTKRCPEVPSLIIYGESEETPKGYSLEYLPNGKLLDFEQCGHMVNLEQPEEFNQVLQDWLQAHKSK